jgi:hypothetical protein
MKRPGDTTPDPPGGRAAERLRMFEDARRPPAKGDHATSAVKKTAKGPKASRSAKKRSPRHEKQDRRKR